MRRAGIRLSPSSTTRPAGLDGPRRLAPPRRDPAPQRLQATPPGGRIQVRASRDDGELSGRSATAAGTDRGRGQPPVRPVLSAADRPAAAWAWAFPRRPDRRTGRRPVSAGRQTPARGPYFRSICHCQRHPNKTHPYPSLRLGRRGMAIAHARARPTCRARSLHLSPPDRGLLRHARDRFVTQNPSVWIILSAGVEFNRRRGRNAELERIHWWMDEPPLAATNLVWLRAHEYHEFSHQER